MAFDLENDSYNVPVGLGIGKVVPAGGAVFNIFVEPQYTILDRGAGQPELQMFVGVQHAVREEVAAGAGGNRP